MDDEVYAAIGIGIQNGIMRLKREYGELIRAFGVTDDERLYIALAEDISEEKKDEIRRKFVTFIT
ncbi:MAG: hypothetical protein R3346_04005 [Candidatus Spechtbacterales bacterium]|nr:hypothetical protein [Candidatus Spechtbacterales bacterium]